MAQKYMKVSKVAEMFGLTREQIRQYCKQPGQRFAFQPAGKNGCFLIDIEKFEKWVKMYPVGLI